MLRDCQTQFDMARVELSNLPLTRQGRQVLIVSAPSTEAAAPLNLWNIGHTARHQDSNEAELCVTTAGAC